MLHPMMMTPRSYRPARDVRHLLRDKSGVAGIEFALLAPVFFMFMFAILEIAFIVWFSSLVNDGAAEADRYLRSETMKCTRQGTRASNCTAASMQGMRNAVCGVIDIVMSCDSSKLKIAVYSADDLVANPVSPASMVDNVDLNLGSSRGYIIAIGYEWPFAMPTSKLLLPSNGTRKQLQARVFASTAEKALR